MFEWIQVAQWIVYALVLFYVDFNYLLFLVASFFPHEAKMHKLKMYPKISVIIPTRNEAHVIEETLKRLRRSNYPKNKLEIIVVDANSTDGTRQIAKRYANKVILEKRPKGKPHALNTGLKKAKGELIYFLDADNWVHEDTILDLVQGMETNAITGLASIRNNKKLIEKVSSMENSLHNLIERGMSKIFNTEIVAGYNFLIKKKTLKKIGYFRDALTEDINLSFRLYKSNERIKLTNAPCSILVPNNFMAYWKQQERWRRGGFDEIIKSAKVSSLFDIFVKIAFLGLSAITGTVSLILLILAIIFWDIVLLSGFIIGALLIISATIKYNKKAELIYLPVVYIYYTILEIASILKVLFEELTGKRIGWQKTPK